MSILTMGEAMLLVRRPSTSWYETAVSIAGAESNAAIGLARLGHAVTWASTLGDDPAGDLILNTLRGEGITVQADRRSTEVTGLLLRCGRALGEPVVHYYRKDSAFAVAPPTPDPTGHELVLLTGITPALSPACRQAARAVAAAASRLAFDLNLRRTLWSAADAAPELRWFCSHADIVFATADEAAVVVGEAPSEQLGERLCALGCGIAVVRHGRRGASCTTANETVWAPEHPGITVRDPIGAGDAFAAGFLSAHLDGMTPGECLSRAHRCGAAVCATAGDWEGALHRHDLTIDHQKEAKR